MEVITNKEGLSRYTIHEEYTAGIVLTGAEVKSIKRGMMSLRNTYCSIEGGQIYLYNAHITPWQMNNQPGYNPQRPRVLLLKKSEMHSLLGKLAQKGLTMIPKNVYSKSGLIKVTLAVVSGIKRHDKRALIKKREVDRDMARLMKQR